MAFGPLLLSGAFLLTGCNLAPNYVRPQVSVDGFFAHRQQAPEGHAQLGQNWWTAFGDDQLDLLVDNALTANLDLKTAVARIEQARAALESSDSLLLPTIDTRPGFTRNRVSGTVDNALPKRMMRTWAVPLNASYEVDLWGRVRGDIKVGEENLLSSEAGAESARLSIAAEVSSLYLTLRYTDLDIIQLRHAIDLRRVALQLNEGRRKAGVATDLDVLRAETELSTTEADLADAVQTRENLVDGLAVLCGRSPTDFTVSTNYSPLTIPVVPVGLPSELIERRPDVYAAERQLIAANEQIGIAKTAYLPSLTLTADGGFASRDLGTFLDRNSSVWSLAVGLGLTIFDGGRRDALVSSATAGYDGTRALYEKSVLEAIREVQDSLNDIEASRARVKKYVEASRTSEATASLSRSRYRHGYISYFEVVDSDRNALNAQRTLIHSQQALAVSTVSLVKALGGGWQSSNLEVRSASESPAR